MSKFVGCVLDFVVVEEVLNMEEWEGSVQAHNAYSWVFIVRKS